MDFNIDLVGFDNGELDNLGLNDKDLNLDNSCLDNNGTIMDKFGIAPFTVFDARSGNWQRRKKYWISKGITSSDGREDGMIFNTELTSIEGKDTSIFDPVLCEIGYSWFCPKNGSIFDPFAGGSVRGIMASFLDKHYVGIDLRQEQIDANNGQLHLIEDNNAPTWICGDSLNAKELVGSDFKADLIFSCPPYADLEVYSDNPKDLSNMDYEKFIEVYKKIIQNCYDILKDDTFVFWVVGEVRDKKGNYYNFVGDTVQAFLNTGFNYYNEAILVTAVGSASLRVGRYMKASRKLGKTHQNILIFLKGDAKKATAKCGEIEMELIEDNIEISED